MKIIDFLFKERSAWLSYSIGLVMAIVMSIYLFPLSFLQGQGAFFDQGDPAQHVSGWLFYVHDQWRFPLTYTQQLNYPEGANIALTDSIPLAAVVAKLFRAWLPDGFHYIGWWHLLVYLLQSTAAVLLIRALGYRNLIAIFSAAALSLLMPALTFRFIHASLTTQALILFAMSAYVCGMKNHVSLWKSSGFFIVIILAALLVHPYLFGMIYPIYLAFLVDYGRRKRIVTPCLLSFLISVLLVLGTFFIFGYFGFAGDEGFGFYSMNQLSPLCGGKYSFSCEYGTPGQYEGFNYLGLGLIGTLLLVMIIDWRWLLRLPRQFPAATMVLVLLWLFALSNEIYVGHHHILSYPLPDAFNKLITAFRASGRFFWPVGYVLLFIGIVGLLRQPKPAFITLVLLTAVLLQWIDTRDLINQQRSALRKVSTTDYSRWDALTQSVVAIDIFPLYCQNQGDHNKYHFFQMLAAKNHLPLNTAVLAHCVGSAEKKDLFNRPLANNHLYIVFSQTPPVAPIPLGIQQMLRDHQCRKFKQEQTEGMACVPSSNAQWWQEKAPWMAAQ